MTDAGDVADAKSRVGGRRNRVSAFVGVCVLVVGVVSLEQTAVQQRESRIQNWRKFLTVELVVHRLLARRMPMFRFYYRFIIPVRIRSGKTTQFGSEFVLVCPIRNFSNSVTARVSHLRPPMLYLDCALRFLQNCVQFATNEARGQESGAKAGCR